MDIILSSFCFNTSKTDRHDYKSERGGRIHNLYQNMPPVCFRNLGASFEPDYSIFFIGDNFFVDTDTIEKMEKQPHYAKHQELFKSLNEIGKLKVIDYGKTIEPYSEIINNSYTQDLNNIIDWRNEFIQLIELWEEFVFHATYNSNFKRTSKYHWESDELTSIDDILSVLTAGMVGGILDYRIRQNLLNWDKGIQREYKEFTLACLAPYLKHVSSSLCLADKLNAVIHDWADITPLYKKKLINSIRPSTIENLDEHEKCRQLIKLMFPEFQPKNMSALIKALTDKRVEELKKMISESVRNNVEFDNEFANATLREIIFKNQKVNKYKNIVGWATMPLSMIPWAGTALEKGTQLILENAIERRVMKSKSWFFLLSEVTVSK